MRHYSNCSKTKLFTLHISTIKTVLHQQNKGKSLQTFFNRFMLVALGIYWTCLVLTMYIIAVLVYFGSITSKLGFFCMWPFQPNSNYNFWMIMNGWKRHLQICVFCSAHHMLCLTPPPPGRPHLATPWAPPPPDPPFHIDPVSHQLNKVSP